MGSVVIDMDRVFRLKGKHNLFSSLVKYMRVPNNIQDHFLEMPQLENLNFLGTVGITTLGSQLCFVVLQKYNLGSGPVKEMQFPQSLRFFHIRRYVWTYVLLKNYFKLGLLSLEHTKGISMPDSVLLSFREKL